METRGALSSLAKGSLPLPRGRGALFSPIKTRSFFILVELHGALSSHLVFGDEAENFCVVVEIWGGSVLTC